MGKITVRFFASARQIAGCVETTIPCRDAALSQDDFWAQLLTEFPALARLRGTVRLARNQEYATPATVFTEGDEVALIPPVSGG